MTRVDEIAANIFRISTYFPEFNLQFNQFLVKDDEPLLFETGMKQMFPLVRDAVSKVIDPASLRYVSFSHFEPDERHHRSQKPYCRQRCKWPRREAQVQASH